MESKGTLTRTDLTTDQRIASALERIAALMERQSLPIVNIPSAHGKGCVVCGRGSDGRTFDHYVCGHPDCPSRVTFVALTGGPR